MKVTIEIEKEILEQAMKLTGENQSGPAVAKATSEFVRVRRRMIREFADLAMAGEFGDYPMTNEQLEDFDR